MILDLRHAVRQLRRQPLFAAVTIGVLALGIGASAALFSLVDAVLVRELPFADPRLMRGQARERAGGRASGHGADRFLLFRRWRAPSA